MDHHNGHDHPVSEGIDGAELPSRGAEAMPGEESGRSHRSMESSAASPGAAVHRGGSGEHAHHATAAAPGGGHPGHADHAAGGHDKHAGHSVEMFRSKFWISLALTVPTVIWGHMLAELTGFMAPMFTGSEWIPAIFGTGVFLYGGLVFLRGAAGEQTGYLICTMENLT